VLSAYLVHCGANYVSNKKILELGSGTGLVGLIAAQLGAHTVCITDQASVLFSSSGCSTGS
jgi:predicted nicotinamide N-methyase